MREVLFRGKTKQGEWVYGQYCELRDGKTTIPCIYYKGEIIKDTLGQYTGLTDKNGKKIFEGDIVEVEHTLRTIHRGEIPESYKPRRSHSCWWDEKRDEMHYKRNYAVEWKKKDARWILRNGSDQHDLRDIFLHFHDGIVIGNIHDNPELLNR